MMDIIIYQINLSRDDDRVAYLGLSQLDKFQGSSEVNSGIYDKVFEGAVEVDTLEGVYQMSMLRQKAMLRPSAQTASISPFAARQAICLSLIWRVVVF